MGSLWCKLLKIWCGDAKDADRENIGCNGKCKSCYASELIAFQDLDGQPMVVKKADKLIMSELRFEGYSDDTFGEWCTTGDNVDNCASMEPIQCMVDCGEHGRLMVIGQYSKASCGNGCWMIGVSKVDEQDEFPNWRTEICQCEDALHSPSLSLYVPTRRIDLTWYKNGKKVEY